MVQEAKKMDFFYFLSFGHYNGVVINTGQKSNSSTIVVTNAHLIWWTGGVLWEWAVRNLHRARGSITNAHSAAAAACLIGITSMEKHTHITEHQPPKRAGLGSLAHKHFLLPHQERIIFSRRVINPCRRRASASCHQHLKMVQNRRTTAPAFYTCWLVHNAGRL